MNNTLAINYFPLNLKWKLSFQYLYPLLFVLIGLLFVLDIFQINSVIQNTYLLKNYEKELNLLSEDTKNLEIKLAQTNTLENIETLIKDSSYKKIEEIRYIQLIGSQVVTK